jgi:hypothetical protein
MNRTKNLIDLDDRRNRYIIVKTNPTNPRMLAIFQTEYADGPRARAKEWK